MIIERAEFPVKSGEENALVEAMKRARKILEAADGCHRVEFGRGVENPEKFILLLLWDSVDAHVALTKTPMFDEFKKTVGPYFAGPSNMEHFEIC